VAFFRGVEQKADPTTSFFLELRAEPEWLIAGSVDGAHVILGTPPTIS
jgi:hypothetical protein